MKKSFTKTLVLACIVALTVINATAQTCWKMIAKGSNSINSIGIKTDGSLWAWGWNQYGQLGDGTNINKYTPTQIGTNTNWAFVSAGGGNTTAIKTDGTLWAWGWNLYGQLGDGTNYDKYSPTQIGSDTSWLSIASTGHSLGIKSDGTLWAWGRNNEGQLGDGTIVDKNIPIQIGSATNWYSVSAGNEHSIGIKIDGTLWTWGYNTFGQIGDGTFSNIYTPIQIGNATNWYSVSAGGNYNIAIKTDGTLWAWGDNRYGQLGDGSINNKVFPTQMGSANNWKSVIGGQEHTLGIKTDGTLWSWGINSRGQLGNGTYGFLTYKAIPTQIGNDTNWKSVAAFKDHTIAIKADGSIWCWGNNGLGQLGDGTNIAKYIPTAIACPNTTLPISISKFYVAKQSNTALLSWSSATEINAKEYQIEKSTADKSFQQIGVVAAKGKAGNYTYNDELSTYYSLPTPIYYRLKMVDIDGKFSYSPIRQLTTNNSPLTISLHPNPAKGFVVIEGADNLQTIHVTNATGAILKTIQNIHSNKYVLQVEGLSKGMYYVQIQSNNNNTTQKLTVE